MDFRLSEEQQLLRDSIARFVANEYGFEARKGIVASEKGWSPAVWTQLADMGLLGVPFAEAHGGIGGSMVDVMVVMQELGRGLVVEPYLSTVVLGGGLVNIAGSAAQKQDILPRVAAGKWLLAAAYGEPQSRYDLHDVATTAKRDGGSFVLNGKKSVVLHGATADT
jgi:alkylation response protein AidB-like acyl-CoA dehydrogenase